MTRRIAYLTLQATREGQAAHAHVNEIVNGLRELGYQVDLFEPAYGTSEHPSAQRRLLEFLLVQLRLARKIREYDIVYIRAHFAAWPTAAFARLRRIPVLQEVNGPYSDVLAAWPGMRVLGSVFTALQRQQFRWADHLITVTGGLAATVARELHRPPCDFTIIQNAANVALFTPDAVCEVSLPSDYACFFGALAPWQGIGTILDALADPSWPTGVSVVIVGDGVEADRVRAAAETDARVVFLGTRPYRELPGIVAHSICGLCVKSGAGRSDTGLSPLKLYETMAAGVPVVVSDVPGLKETINESQSGLVVPPDDPHELAIAVESLAANPAEAREMGGRGRNAAVKEHSWSARSRQTADVIESTIADYESR